ncbi:MAG: hypothetical protein R3F19_29380 [Verrucomicrobiales bacterium]
MLIQLELERGRPEAALPYARAALTAPTPTDEILRKGAKRAIDAILERIEGSFADQPELLVDVFQQALTSELVGVEVWRVLGRALHGRYRLSHELRDLRLASVCLLKASRIADATAVKIVSEWIGTDEKASGLKAPEFLIDSRTAWRYRVHAPQDSAWRRSGYDAGAWPSGHGEFGYGDGDEDTRMEDGENPDKMPASACFRLEFKVGKRYTRPLVATISHDNGAIVYIDGEEVYRAMMPPGEPTPETLATGIQAIEAQPRGFAILPELLAPDRSVVIAVQVHQAPLDAGDLSFSFSLAEPLPSLGDVLGRVPPEELEGFFGKVAASLAPGK